MPSRTRRFFLNFISLTATALLMRGVGVAFNVYVSNTAGAETMGLYSLLGGIYGFAVTVGCAGINLGTTRVISDAMGLGDKSLARRAAARALIIAFVTSLATTVILLALSGYIGFRILSDPRIIRPLQILALSLVPVAMCSSLSGYFTAVRRVRASSLIQILVQGVKIILTTLFLGLLVKKGPEHACIALVLGATLSEVFSLCTTYVLYRIDLKRNSLENADIGKESKGLTKMILSITLPVTVSACVRSGLTTLQHILIPKGLKASGKSWSAALASYGILHSMVMPLILFPSAFITSFSGLLIPEVTECRVRNNDVRLKRISYRILTLSLIFSIGVAGIVAYFSDKLGLVIYNSLEAAYYIRVMAPLIPIMYIDSAVDAILKGMGREVYSMNVNIADALTACLFAIFLIPRMGLMGYVISIYATEILNTCLSLIKMASITKMKFRIFHQILMPSLCVVGAASCSSLVLRVMRLSNSAFSLVMHIAFAVAFYIFFLYLTGAVGDDEREVISFALKK